jgi:predicted KAP-like P-loop ATPase
MFFHELEVAVKGKKALSTYKDKTIKLLNLFSGILSVGTLSPVGSQYFSKGTEVTNRISATIKEAADSSIDEIKKELDELLFKTARRIFILIDDIDRLDQQSAELLFRMIRLNADFKNTTYVLSFDPKIVEQLLKEEQPGYGRQYIEKIIQLPIDIPVIDNALLVEILVGELNNRIIKNDADRFDEKLWRELVTSGEFFRYFRTIRDVVRYVNGLTLNYSIRANDVNMVDFIALEAIRTFASESYDSIRRNKAILTRLTYSRGGLDAGENIEETKKILSEIFHIEQTSARQSNEIGRLGETVKATCRVLFPQLDRVYSNHSYTRSSEKKWRQEKRICSDEIFDNYFLVGVPKGEISDQEMRSILARSDNHSRFIDALNEIFDRNLGTRFLSRAEDYLDSIQSIYETILALFEIEDRILSEPRKMLATGADTATSWLICLLLKREESASRKQDIKQDIRKAIVASNKLYLPVYFVSFISPDKDEADSEKRISRDLGFSDADLHELQVACVAKIKEFAESGRLSKSSHLGLILFRWLIWGTADEAKVYANKLIETDEGVVDLLVGFAGEALSDGKRWVTIKKTNIAKFVDVKVVEERVNKNITPKIEQLNASQKEAVEAFLIAGTTFDN